MEGGLTMNKKDIEMVTKLITVIMDTELIDIAYATECEKRVPVKFALTVPIGEKRIGRAFLRHRYDILLSTDIMKKCELYKFLAKGCNCSVGKIQRICEGAGVGISDHRKRRNKLDQRLANRKKRREYREQWEMERENDPMIIKYAEACLEMLRDIQERRERQKLLKILKS
jgi:hypothetical protein